jgi:hypothetical protein
MMDTATAAWRADPIRRHFLQFAWDVRAEGRRLDRLGVRPDREYDDEQWAALCNWAGRGGLVALRAQTRNVEAELHQKQAAGKSAPTAIEFYKTLFANTTGPVYTASYTNERGAAPEERIIMRKAGAITTFLKKWDRPGRGAFVCLGVLKEGALRRAKENIEYTVCLHADIDFKNVDGLGANPRAEALRQVSRLKYQPSIIVFSGGGLHVYWLFKEPLETQGNIDRIERALKQLADVVAGDLVVCEVARVMPSPT